MACVQAAVDHSTHKCCIGSFLMAQGGAKVHVQKAIKQRVYAASRRARAATLGLLVLLRRLAEAVVMISSDDEGEGEAESSMVDLLVAHGPLLIDYGDERLALWDKVQGKRLLRQLMLGTATADKPIAAVEELHSEVSTGRAIHLLCLLHG
jgi:hypothetical protein